MAPRRKTLAQLAALELAGVDPSNLADFFRISPWDPDDLRLPLLEFIIDYLKGRTSDPLCPIYLTLDDSLTPKDKGTRQLESVIGISTIIRSEPSRPAIMSSCAFIGETFISPCRGVPICVPAPSGGSTAAARTPNCVTAANWTLAREMLQQVIHLLPKTNPVYVLFDSWYTSAKLVKWIRQQGWHVIAAIKSNRKVSGQKLTQWHHAFKGRSYDRVSLELANGQRRTYCVRTLQGRLRGVPREVRVLISQRGPGVRTPKYFLCTDLTLSAQEILRRYQNRWSQEVDYWYVKLQLGLGDFRLRRVTRRSASGMPWSTWCWSICTGTVMSPGRPTVRPRVCRKYWHAYAKTTNGKCCARPVKKPPTALPWSRFLSVTWAQQCPKPRDHVPTTAASEDEELPGEGNHIVLRTCRNSRG